MHVVFEVTNYKRAICVLNTCALYVTAKNCQECQTCKLFGHVAKDCVYANCLDVDVDWFNLLFTKSDAPCRRTLQKSTANGVKNTARSNSTSTTSTSCPCPRRRSTQPLLLRRRTLQLRLGLSNSTRASRRSTSINRVSDANAACPFRPSL
jgi:hypothetical protein